MAAHTKIICTIGPSCDSMEKIIELIKAGMNIARLNFSHGTHEKHLAVINRLKEARDKLGVPLAIMLDTRGPEVRIGKIVEGGVSLSAGDRWHLCRDEVEGDSEKVSITPGYILDDLKIGTVVLFDDGYVNSEVVEKTADGVVVEIKNSGMLTSRKGVNIPNVSLTLPAVTERDIADIKFGCEHELEIIAASFVRSAENIITVKNFLKEQGCDNTLVIAKIENHEGLDNFDSILQVSDGVMIARGDLGVEIPLSRVPRMQKEMIRKCYMVGKPSITATQMLESMIVNPRPTRAEVSDVANAIYDSTSAVMLSGETAIGKYPIQTVDVMKSIIKEAESDFNYTNFFELHSKLAYNDVPSSVTLATVKTAYSSNASAIFAFSSSGGVARLLSRLRPAMPIIAMTQRKKTYHQMALNWGVTPFFNDVSSEFRDAFKAISQYALDKKLLHYGDLVVTISGSTFGVAGTTNMMIVEHIGDVLVRGHTGYGGRIHGNISILYSAEGVKPYSIRGQLVVIPKFDDTFIPLLEEAGGFILQNNIDDEVSETALMEAASDFNKSVIVRADAASQILNEGQLVTLDPERALIYKGVVL